jgi:hypothetical protein
MVIAGPVYYTCFDVHYYLHGWTPFYADAFIYTVGANFFPTPG